MTTNLCKSTKKCEAILVQSREYNIKNSCLFSETRIINRFLGSRENMQCVYCELSDSLNDQQIEAFLSLVVWCAAFWNPEKAVTYRTGRRELFETNREIVKTGKLLAELLEKRGQLHDHSGFSSNTHYCIFDLIEKASGENYLYNCYIKERLSDLRCGFDSKYWPSIEDVVSEIALDAEKSEIYATDLVTEASTTSSRASKSDFLRALFTAIEENGSRTYGLISKGFELSDKSVSEIMNNALELDFNELVDATYVKRTRQRIREQRKEGV